MVFWQFYAGNVHMIQIKMYQLILNLFMQTCHLFSKTVPKIKFVKSICPLASFHLADWYWFRKFYWLHITHWDWKSLSAHSSDCQSSARRRNWLKYAVLVIPMSILGWKFQVSSNGTALTKDQSLFDRIIVKSKYNDSGILKHFNWVLAQTFYIFWINRYSWIFLFSSS